MNVNYVTRVENALLVELPTIDRDLLGLYVLLALTRGERTTLEDVHDAWAVWRNRTNSEHKSLVEFDELAPEVQELDRKYMTAIRRTSRRVALDI